LTRFALKYSARRRQRQSWRRLERVALRSTRSRLCKSEKAPLFQRSNAARAQERDSISSYRALALPALALWPALAAAAPATIAIGYLGVGAAPDSIANEGYDGAQQAIADDNTTGKFVGQNFVLKDGRLAEGQDPAQALRSLVKSGVRLILADLPAAPLLALSDLPEAKDVTLFNIRATDIRLRGADCRRNILHTAPDRAMLADALLQYLVVKKWTDIFLVTGPTEEDRAFAAAVKRSIAKFRAKLVAEKEWTYAPGAKRTDTGHYAIGQQVADFTQSLRYDILVVADEDGQFGDDLDYATSLPRPVAGTQGLVPAAWSASHQEWGATQLQNRFLHRSGRPMTSRDYAAWLAVRAVGEAATRAASAEPGQIAGALRSDQFQLPGYKGEPLSFRGWDGQMRQAILLADAHKVVTVSPQRGFLHPTSELDTLGSDQPETQCHAR
jgi:ABC transporter substrate binding protein (PQQ-dependent alcohol dehydrogenase system)